MGRFEESECITIYSCEQNIGRIVSAFIREHGVGYVGTLDEYRCGEE